MKRAAIQKQILQKKKQNVSKYIYIIIVLFTVSCVSQKKVHVFFGEGFEGVRSTIVTQITTNDGRFIYDTIIKNKVINSNYITGLAEHIKINTPKYKRIVIYFIVNEKKSYLMFNNIKNNTQILIEPSNNIDSSSTCFLLNFSIFDENFNLEFY